jgi:hypothetical protein
MKSINQEKGTDRLARKQALKLIRARWKMDSKTRHDTVLKQKRQHLLGWLAWN